MKTFNRLFYTVAIALMCCFTTRAVANQNASPIKSLNFSLWSEYKRNHFEGLTQAEKTEKLQNIFKDKLTFVKKHGIRRLIVKIMDPVEFEFFHPENFSYGKEDNFYHWACLLANDVTLEALFDSSQFKYAPECLFDRLAGCYGSLRDYFGRQEKPFGDFQNVIEKMEWVAWTNEIYGAAERNRALISGVTLNPRGIGNSITYYQNLVNAFDQFRFQPLEDCHVPEWIPQNSYSGIRIAMLLPLDMKDFAIANAANLPMYTDMRLPNDASQLGITPPQNYPSGPPRYPLPVWRSENHKGPLLDTIYLNLADPRLIASIYQNYNELPKPDQNTPSSVIAKLSENLQKVFQGLAYVKGPGFISNHPSSTVVSGNYTFFRTGSTNGEGQFAQNGYIEVRPPYVSETIVRSIVAVPQSNREMSISSPFSTTHVLDNIEYWQCPIPSNWASLKTSNELRSRIYFVFSTSCDSEKDKFFGNWSLQNFLNFIQGDSINLGFIHKNLFLDMNQQLVKPNNNLVLYDFSTIPNGKPFPEVNWDLGNQNY